MKQAIQSQFPDILSYPVFYDEPEQCPLCHFSIAPNHIKDEWYLDSRSRRHLAIFYSNRSRRSPAVPLGSATMKRITLESTRIVIQQI